MRLERVGKKGTRRSIGTRKLAAALVVLLATAVCAGSEDKQSQSEEDDVIWDDGDQPES